MESGVNLTTRMVLKRRADKRIKLRKTTAKQNQINKPSTQIICTQHITAKAALLFNTLFEDIK